jgi:hypothetical protein
VTRKFKVFIETHASSIINIELNDEKLAEVATDLGTTVAELTVDDLREIAADHAMSRFGGPSVCAQCAGWGHRGEGSTGVELGDDWDVVEDTEYTQGVEEVDKF